MCKWTTNKLLIFYGASHKSLIDLVSSASVLLCMLIQYILLFLLISFPFSLLYSLTFVCLFVCLLSLVFSRFLHQWFLANHKPKRLETLPRPWHYVVLGGPFFFPHLQRVSQVPAFPQGCVLSWLIQWPV